MKTLLTLGAVTTTALILSACSQPTETPTQEQAPAPQLVAGISVTDPWCRPTPNGAKVAGCYVTLTSGTNDVLTGLTTDLAEMPQIHEMKHEDGMMKMGELKDGLPLPAGQKVELKPGGNHVMLMGLKAPLVEGQIAKMTLNFKSGETLPVEFVVRTPPVIDSEE